MGHTNTTTHKLDTHHANQKLKLFYLIMGEAIDGCTAFNLALCVAIAWGVPEYLSADCFAKFAFFYPIYASLCAVGGNGCVKNWAATGLFTLVSTSFPLGSLKSQSPTSNSFNTPSSSTACTLNSMAPASSPLNSWDQSSL